MSDFTRILKSVLPYNAAPERHAYRLTGGRIGWSGGTICKAYGSGYHSAAILTYPETDYDGDFVNPEGGNWSPFYANPVVNFDHGVPVGTGTVEMKSVPTGNLHVNVPVGRTKFFETAADCRGLVLNGRDPHTGAEKRYTPDDCLQLANQVRSLVTNDIVRGVSIEFRPDGSVNDAYWPTGEHSALLNRPAYHFERWQGLTWTHAERPKNPSAQTLAPELTEKAFKIVRDGRIGNERLHDVIMKSFTRWLPANKSVTVRVEKAMPQQPQMPGFDETDMAATNDDDAGIPVDTDEDTTDTTPPTARAAYDLVQQVEELLTQFDKAVATSEHEKGADRLEKCVANLRAELEDISAAADMIHDSVSSRGKKPSEPPTDDEPADDDADDDMDEDEREEKAFRSRVKPLVWDESKVLITKSGYTPRGLRFKASDLGEPVKKSVPSESPADAEDALRELAAANRELKRENKRLRTLTR